MNKIEQRQCIGIERGGGWQSREQYVYNHRSRRSGEVKRFVLLVPTYHQPSGEVKGFVLLVPTYHQPSEDVKRFVLMVPTYHQPTAPQQEITYKCHADCRGGFFERDSGERASGQPQV